ncbi:hypothetical protein LCGC14_0501220 [marine sediment metagenome]|uniref:Uncharacterized protein n=1 Tax=marine sediment metagenome TaxID=412755 RepID=A0A0F9SMD4_9ZZZZ
MMDILLTWQSLIIFFFGILCGASLMNFLIYYIILVKKKPPDFLHGEVFVVSNLDSRDAIPNAKLYVGLMVLVVEDDMNYYQVDKDLKWVKANVVRYEC